MKLDRKPAIWGADALKRRPECWLEPLPASIAAREDTKLLLQLVRISHAGLKQSVLTLFRSVWSTMLHVSSHILARH